MVCASAQSSHGEKRLVLQPNRSLTWKQTKVVFLFLAFCLLSIAFYFAIKGAWLVLPFTGLELVVIGFGLYLQCRYSHQQQVIHIDRESISVSDGRNRGGEQVCFSKSWLKIIHKNDSRGWYPNRLLIGSHGQYLEVGQFLVESERNRLADDLRRAIQGA